MRRRFKLEPLLHALLAGAALTPAVSCGGSSVENPGAGGSTSQRLGVCDNPVASDASGWVSCDGFSHREAAGTCLSSVPRASAPTASCNDSDCAAMLYGHCWDPGTTGLVPQSTCIPGCVQDSDCATGEICFCEDPVGRCIPADCTTDTDCGPDALCSTYVGPESPACGFYVAGTACQKESDACVGDECNCAMVGGERACVQGLGGCGRPFLVDGIERRARSETRDDWVAPGGESPSLVALSPSVRARLAEHWKLAGLLEHASIAAFARFSLELLALGAPSELVAEATQAMADETRHAALCFSFASAYGGARLGPGPLSVSDCLGEPTLASVLKTALLEGALGETIAAAEARELARVATDPLVRDALERIASDETRHAALAYRFVRWALERDAVAVSKLIRETLATERRKTFLEAARDDGAGESASLALGLPTKAFRASLRREVLERVVTPCLQTLLEMPARAATARPSRVTWAPSAA